LNKIKEWNEQAEEWNEQEGLSEDEDGFVAPLYPRPIGIAWCIEPSRSLEEQRGDLSLLRRQGKLLINSTTKPRLFLRCAEFQQPLVEWSTNEFELVEAKQFLCHQAAQVAFMAMTLEDSGLPKLAVPSQVRSSGEAQLHGASFKQMNEEHQRSQECPASAFVLMKSRFLELRCIADVFKKAMYGTFVFHTWHFHAEDIEFAEPGSGIPHYMVYNATIRLLQLYPEVNAHTDIFSFTPTYVLFPYTECSVSCSPSKTSPHRRSASFRS
jgi:hypothetical protein